MGFLEDHHPEGDLPRIPEYYKGKTVFITGGTGFLGQVLVEKLLYSCEGLDRIYLLMRSRRGINVQERLEKLYSSSCFDRLRKKNPTIFNEKVAAVSGDISGIGLDLSDADRSMLQESVNIVFHIAASIRFDDPLSKAVILNLRGTREMIRLAKEMTKLEAFVHVSTVYSNCTQRVITEKIYPPAVNWKDLIKITEELDQASLSIFENKYLASYPNTYTFTKQLAEQVVAEQQGILPVVIARPSVVIGSFKEPMPGWTEKYHGMNGVLVGLGKGVLKVHLTAPSNHINLIFVDTCALQFIVASWARGAQPLSPKDQITVYNVCASPEHEVEFRDMAQYNTKLVQNYPLQTTLGVPSLTITNSLYYYYLLFFLLQLVPALLVDSLLYILGRKIFLIKLQGRILTTTLSTTTFTCQKWIIENQNFLKLQTYLTGIDKENFTYYYKNYDIVKSYYVNWNGIKHYFLKEHAEDQPAAAARMKRLIAIQAAVKYTMIAFIVWKLYIFVSSQFVTM